MGEAAVRAAGCSGRLEAACWPCTCDATSHKKNWVPPRQQGASCKQAKQTASPEHSAPSRMSDQEKPVLPSCTPGSHSTAGAAAAKTRRGGLLKGGPGCVHKHGALWMLAQHATHMP